MSMTAVTEALQLRHRALTGVAYAPDDLPGDLNPDTQLPAIIVDPLEAVNVGQSHGNGLVVERRSYRVKLCAALANLEGSYTIGTPRTTARAILDLMLADYRSNPEITPTAFINITDPQGLRDMGILPHPVTENAVVHRGLTYAGSYVYLMVEEHYGSS